MATNPDNVGVLPELLPCPHCGGESETCHEPGYGWMVRCMCCSKQFFQPAEAQAVDNWNRRELCRAAPAGGDVWAFEGRDWMRPKRDQVPARDSLCQQLQQKCSDWGTYWRAPDAHGVELTVDQALELLRDALGVEVEIKDSAPAGSGEVEAMLNTWLVRYNELINMDRTNEAEQVLRCINDGKAALLRKLQQGAE